MIKKISFFETRTHKKQYLPLEQPLKIYTCGPTVYRYAHIGNLRCYIVADTFVRSVKFLGGTCKHIINVTDIGHLDEGDNDKVLSLGLDHKKICLFYFEKFVQDLNSLKIQLPSSFCWATDYISEQLEIIKTIEEKKCVYHDEKGVYLDIEKVQIEQEFLLASIETMLASEEGRRKASFALWRLCENGLFDSKYGRGNPGWHIECLAIIRKELGEQIDVHLGGFDHISVHHNNEIIQSSILGNSLLSKNWLHVNLLMQEGVKMSKSRNNVVLLDEVIAKGFSPFDYRMFVLLTNFRKKVDFSWDAIKKVADSRKDLIDKMAINLQMGFPELTLEEKLALEEKISSFDTSGTIRQIQALLKTERDCKYMLKVCEDVLALNIKQEIEKLSQIEPEIKEILDALIKERMLAKNNLRWVEADVLKLRIENMGYRVFDFCDKVVVLKKYA